MLFSLMMKRSLFLLIFNHSRGTWHAWHFPTWVENCQNARGCFSTGDCSVHSLSTDFIGPYHGFALIRTSDIIFLLDLSIIRCFMKFFFKFERVLLATRGCPRTLKTPNSPPLLSNLRDGLSCPRTEARRAITRNAYNTKQIHCKRTLLI